MYFVKVKDQNKKCNESNGKMGTFQIRKLLAQLLSVIKKFAPELNIYSIQCE